MAEPENLTLHMLREIRAEIKDMRGEMATKAELADLRSEMKSGFANVASDVFALDAKIDKTRKELSEQVVGLRRAVVEYHSTVVGHGMLISDLDARLRRVEQHLNLSPPETH